MQLYLNKAKYNDNLFIPGFNQKDYLSLIPDRLDLELSTIHGFYFEK